MIIIIIVAVILALFGIGFVVGLVEQKKSHIEVDCPKAEQPKTAYLIAEIDDEVLIYLEELHDALRPRTIKIIEAKDEVKQNLQEAVIDDEIELALEIKRLLGQA